jgi:hypothetical protein
MSKCQLIGVVFGSRLPEKPPRDRMLRRVEGGAWAREDSSSIISHRDHAGN